ncbi:AzlD domain-containing protein [Azospirillum sp. TSO22-1]|uniref:AzlD family protein n=1 Tax=Azospirillum sp. TSO22-1 TaxID=716789 RepID=UPI000D6207C2|nr:AzlD domain-containing protein [Azospirillum sp. TSO22-1]PWC31815.1 branched-chain amino acid transporter [Azospirillum sp. TSO22-1]
MPDAEIALLAIAGMAAVTYATRAGGLWLMVHVPMSRRVEAFLRYLSGSVLVALVVPAALQEGAAAWIAVAVAALVMLAAKRTLLALVLGVAVAAAYRAL